MIDTHRQTIPVGYQKHTEHLQQVYVCEPVCSYSDLSTRVCTCEMTARVCTFTQDYRNAGLFSVRLEEAPLNP